MKKALSCFLLAIASIAAVACSSQGPVDTADNASHAEALQSQADQIYASTRFDHGVPILPDGFTKVVPGSQQRVGAKDFHWADDDGGADVEMRCAGDKNAYGVCCGWFCDGAGGCGGACCTYVYGERIGC